MARERVATGDVATLERAAVEAALAVAAGVDAAAFYRLVDMPRPSRSYFVRDGRHDHSLKAIVAYALQQARSDRRARDFHAIDAANRLRALGFEIVHRD